MKLIKQFHDSINQSTTIKINRNFLQLFFNDLYDDNIKALTLTDRV